MEGFSMDFLETKMGGSGGTLSETNVSFWKVVVGRLLSLLLRRPIFRDYVRFREGDINIYIYIYTQPLLLAIICDGREPQWGISWEWFGMGVGEVLFCDMEGDAVQNKPNHCKINVPVTLYDYSLRLWVISYEVLKKRLRGHDGHVNHMAGREGQTLCIKGHGLSTLGGWVWCTMLLWGVTKAGSPVAVSKVCFFGT